MPLGRVPAPFRYPRADHLRQFLRRLLSRDKTTISLPQETIETRILYDGQDPPPRYTPRRSDSAKDNDPNASELRDPPPSYVPLSHAAAEDDRSVFAPVHDQASTDPAIDEPRNLDVPSQSNTSNTTSSTETPLHDHSPTSRTPICLYEMLSLKRAQDIVIPNGSAIVYRFHVHISHDLGLCKPASYVPVFIEDHGQYKRMNDSLIFPSFWNMDSTYLISSQDLCEESIQGLSLFARAQLSPHIQRADVKVVVAILGLLDASQSRVNLTSSSETEGRPGIPMAACDSCVTKTRIYHVGTGIRVAVYQYLGNRKSPMDPVWLATQKQELTRRIH